jgi:ABC-type multidrug transport system fused ATPase/permease subunit
MDLEKLYENIILRDLFQYLTPGSLTLIGLCIFFESVLRKLGINISVYAALTGSFLSLFMAFVLSYAAGHLLTSAHTLFLRKREQERTAEVLDKNNWLSERVNFLAKNYFHDAGLDGETVQSLTDDSETLREMVRALIYQRRPLLNREYVVRHSILSRFCQNMALALITLLVLVLLSAWVRWDEVMTRVRQAPLLAIFAGIFTLLITALSIAAFFKRADRLRRMMIKHTFQIWYTDYIETRGEKRQDNR